MAVLRRLRWVVPAVALWWGVAWAAVRCPVCGQTFGDDVTTCPNDGTRLDLVGEPVEEHRDTDGAFDTDTEQQRGHVDAEEEAPDEAGGGRYRRADRGKRKRLPSEEEETQVRTDRRRRIGDARSGGQVAVRQEQQPPAEAVDRTLRRAFFERADAERRRRLEAADRAERAERQARERARLRRWNRGAPWVWLGYRMTWMRDGQDPAVLQGAEFGFNAMRDMGRVHLASFVGVRGRKHRGDLFFLESFGIGLQRPWRVAPFVQGRFGVGGLVEDVMGSLRTRLVRAVGVEAGVDVRVAQWLVITPVVGMMRLVVDNAGWTTATWGVSVGY